MLRDMKPKGDSLDDVKAANTAAVASAMVSAHEAGIPYFEADDRFIDAVYPDGHRVAMEKIKALPSHSSDRAA